MSFPVGRLTALRRKELKRWLAVVPAYMTLAAATVSASARASEQIFKHDLDAGHTGNGISAIDFP